MQHVTGGKNKMKKFYVINVFSGGTFIRTDKAFFDRFNPFDVNWRMEVEAENEDEAARKVVDNLIEEQEKPS